MQPFRAVAVFYHVARLNSIAGAAAALNVTPSAVGQQLKTLEEQIGPALITRRGRNVGLTGAGERCFEMISDKIKGIMRATDATHGRPQQTTLVIRATPI